MKKKKKCLVLLSCYNGEKYIASQIESILSQIGIDLHIIVRDDGSFDKTLEILNELKNTYPGKITIIEGENVGIHKSFFKLFETAKDMCFDYVAFSDQDDVWDSDKINIAINTMNTQKTDFYSSSSRIVDEELTYFGKNTANEKKNNFYKTKERAILTPGTQGCTIVITKDFYEFVYANRMPDYYGHDTWLTIIAYLFFDSSYDPTPHMSYRQHNSSWTGNRINAFSQFKREFRFFIKGLSRYKTLANDIVIRFEEKLNKRTVKLLKKIGQKRNIIDTFSLFFSFKYRKYGWIENIVFKLFILFGKA